MDIYEIKVGQTVRFKRPEDKASQTGVVRSIDRISGTVSVEVPPTRGVVRVVVTFVEAVVAASAPRMVECKKSKHHGFYRDDKTCELCPPRETTMSGGTTGSVSYSFVANIAAGLGWYYHEYPVLSVWKVLLMDPTGRLVIKTNALETDLQIVRRCVLADHLKYKGPMP